MIFKLTLPHLLPGLLLVLRMTACSPSGRLWFLDLEGVYQTSFKKNRFCFNLPVEYL